MRVGDVVARVDDGRYLPQQLALGKYVKAPGREAIWTGVVEEIRGDMVRIGKGWAGIEMYEVMYSTQEGRK